MALIYLDTETLINLKERPDVNETQAKDRILGEERHQMVLSFWSFVEIAGGRDKRQAMDLARFVEDFNPLWLRDRTFIEADEVRAFFYKEKYSHDFNYNAIYKYPSQIIYDLIGYKTPIGERPTDMVNFWTTNPESLKIINRVRRTHPPIMRTLYRIKGKIDINKVMREETLKRLMPTHDPTGNPITKTIKMDFITSVDIDSIFTKCYALAIEHFLSVFHRSNTSRKPLESDVIDLSHAIALPYVDVFISSDRYLQTGIEYVKRNVIFKTASTFRKLSDSLTLLV